MRGTHEGPVPVANQWVVVHRVGPERSGPLDSVRTSAAGAYALRYKTSGDSAALYFVSTSYGGVAYFTSPLRTPLVNGDDATLIVFDTTSAPVPIHNAGRHFIVGVAQPNGNRPVGEVYDLQNDTTVTAVAKDSLSPVWTTHIPDKAVGFTLNARGDLAAGSILHVGTSVGVLVPISPGIRQIAFTYELPPSAFPLKFPLEKSTGVLEVMVQDPGARVTGAKFRETPAASVDGRTFRRFLAEDIPGDAVIGIEVPRVIGAEREKVYIGVATTLLAAMAAALVLTARRSFSRTRAVARPAAEPRSEGVLREIARLDAEFERNRSPTDLQRADYEARRADLKAQLTGMLASERKRK